MTNQVIQAEQYSIAKLAELLERSPAQIKSYKRILMRAYAADAQIVSFANGSLNAEGLRQLKVIKELFSTGDQHGYCESVWSEKPELRPQPKAPTTADIPSSPAPAAEMPATPAQVTVYEGNHRQTLTAPQFPAEYDLGSMRSELATVESHDDPLALATQFIDGANALMDAMEQDEKTMANKIAQTRQARAAVGRKAEQLKRRHDIYSLRSEILADRQNVETAALNEDFVELQSLGKPAS